MSGERIPPARVVKGGETVGLDAEQMWHPDATPANTADDHPSVIAAALHALKRDVHDGFDRMARALEALSRIEDRIDVIIDRQNHQDQRMDAIELRLVALETKKRRKSAGKK